MSANANGVDWDVLGFVVASDYRRAVLDALDDAGQQLVGEIDEVGE